MQPTLLLVTRLSLSALLICGAIRAQNNVLILMADDVGVDSIGAYAEGANPPATPNIDSLAARGVLFRNAWSNPHCSPTRACVLTGRYSWRTGVGYALFEGSSPQYPVLGLEETTIPEMLDAQRSGYAHAHIGKWHLSDPRNGGAFGPNLAGWSHFAGMLAAHVRSYFSWPRTVNGVTTTSTTYATTQHVSDALSWIQSAPEPWVCHLSFTAAHWPYHAPPANLHSQNLAGLVPSTTPIPFYKAMAEAIDAEIGRLLGSLGPTLLARTDVLFLGDNGTPQAVSEPPFVPSHAKGSPFEGGINVPLIVAGPSVGSPGREEPVLVAAVDLFATVLELCAVQPEVPFVKTDAVSFVRHLRAADRPPVRTTVFAEQFYYSPSQLINRYDTIREATHKLIRYYAPPAAPTELLFDLVADPFEQSNLLPGPLTAAQQAGYAALLAELAQIVNTSGSFSTFGSNSCTGSNGNPVIAATGTPRVGSTYTVSLDRGAANQSVLLFAGASSSRWASLALPLPLLSLGGGAGCFIHASAELVVPTVTGPTGRASVAMPVPNTTLLIAAPVYHSWVVVDPAAPSNPLGVTASNGGVAVIGS